MTRRSITRWANASFAALLLAACGGGSSPPPDAVTPSLTLSPTEWSVAAGGAAKQFTATLTGSSDAIAWSIETAGADAEVGTVSAGLYTPPSSLAAGRDVVVKASAGALVARATVHVAAGADGVTLAVTPPTGSVVAGSMNTIALAADTNYVGTVTWSVAPTLGTLDTTSGATVVYSAPAGLVTADTDVVVTATAGVLTDSTAITVHPTALVVTGPSSVHAGGAAVDFTLTTDPEGNAVAWSVAPTNAGTISGTGTAGTFAPAATVAASTPFQIIATIGSATGSASASLLPAAVPVNVAGRVVDQKGAGYGGATVIVGASSTTTAADGTFSFSSVSTPYDFTVIARDSGNTWVGLFRGVTEAAPRIEVRRSYTSRTATVSGKVISGAALPYGTLVFSEFSSMTAVSNGDYSGLAIWGGTASTSLTLRALGWWMNPDLSPASYLFGSRVVALTDKVPLTGQDISVSPVAAGHVTGTTTFAGAYDLMTSRLGMSAAFDDGAAVSIHSQFFSFSDPNTIGLGKGFDLIVPELPGGRVRVGYSAPGMSGGGGGASAPVTPGQTGVDLTLPEMPVATAPAAGASAVGYGTAFTWANVNVGGMDGVDIDCGLIGIDIRGGPRSAAIPDLASYGVTITSGAACTWYPRWGSYTVDQYVQGAAALDVLPLRRTSQGVSRAFTF